MSKNKRIKELSEQVEDHFKYMAKKGVYKHKMTSFKEPLWRPAGRPIK